jgi:hypothetical protein
MLRFPHRRAPWLTARYWFFNNLLNLGMWQLTLTKSVS